MRMIILLSVVIVLFAVAAGGSWYLQSQQGKDADTPHAGDNNKSAKPGPTITGPKTTPNNDTTPKGPVFKASPGPPDTERLTQLAAAIQQQQETLKVREKEIAVREKQMDIVHEDIEKQKKEIAEARRRVDMELKVLEAKILEFEKLATASDKDRRSVENERKDLERTKLEFEGVEWKNAKDLAKKLESMDPEAAANVIIQMADGQKLDQVVKMFSQMRDRQAAAIFAEIARLDAKLPGQLFERLLTVRTPVPATPK